MLTPRMKELLTFIDQSIRDSGGVCPTYDEMAAEIGVKAKSGINRLVEELEERGFISRTPKRWRSIEVIRRPGEDCAEEINAELLIALKNLFALVQGECPSILEGDHHYDMICAVIAKAEEVDPDALTGCADDQTFAGCSAEGLREAAREVLSYCTCEKPQIKPLANGPWPCGICGKPLETL